MIIKPEEIFRKWCGVLNKMKGDVVYMIKEQKVTGVNRLRIKDNKIRGLGKNVTGSSKKTISNK